MSDSKNSGDLEDSSVLGKPIVLGSTTIQQVLNARLSATREVINCLEKESNAILECRVCRSLFRSLANFIAHKRVYCKHCYRNTTSEGIGTTSYTEPATITVQPTAPGEMEITKTQQTTASNRNRTLARRKKRVNRSVTPKSSESTACAVVSNAKQAEPPERSILFTAIDGVNPSIAVNQGKKLHKQEADSATITDKKMDTHTAHKHSSTFVDNIPSTSNETITVVEPKAGYPNMNLRNRPGRGHSIVHRKLTAVDSPSKHSAVAALRQRGDCDVKTLKCLQCNQRYSSIKTLTFHMINLHSDERKFFPCIYCKSVFSQFWGATRHMKRAHGKSKEHIDKIRDLLRTKAFTKAAFTEHKKIDTDQNSLVSNDEMSESEILMDSASGPSEAEPITTSTASTTEATSAPPSSQALPMALFMCLKCSKAFSKKSSLMRHREICKKAEKTDKAPIVSTTPSIDILDPKGNDATLARGRPRRNIKPKQFYDDTDFYVPEVVKVKNKDGSSVYKLKKDAEPPAEGLLVLEEKKPEENIVKAKDAKSVRVLVQGESVPLLDADDEVKIDRMVDMKKLVCLKCKRQYGSGSNLRRHAVRHLGWRRYKCKLCKFTSYNKSECKSHLRRSHSSQVSQLIDSGVMENIIDLNSFLEDEDKSLKSKGLSAACELSIEGSSGLGESRLNKPIRGVTYIKESSTDYGKGYILPRAERVKESLPSRADSVKSQDIAINPGEIITASEETESTSSGTPESKRRGRSKKFSRTYMSSNSKSRGKLSRLHEVGKSDDKEKTTPSNGSLMAATDSTVAVEIQTEVKVKAEILSPDKKSPGLKLEGLLTKLKKSQPLETSKCDVPQKTEQTDELDLTKLKKE